MGTRGSRLLLATLVTASPAGPMACVAGAVPAPVPAALPPPSALAGRDGGRAVEVFGERRPVR
ncbi:hypothetical protein ACFFV7_41720 [Nonomuraea spiralis]|uniref:Uncharacterized protein n=1 Tax=Nonomuraea spiralis TaxID=46182 RepID=A0ABV5IUV0_9ACTN|nr:hypothetical protein [Nonomuraea spiralis]GGT41295.1 hypothetical protein GCM10010176_101310 [Nonomuraea spiralis]